MAHGRPIRVKHGMRVLEHIAAHGRTHLRRKSDRTMPCVADACGFEPDVRARGIVLLPGGTDDESEDD